MKTLNFMHLLIKMKTLLRNYLQSKFWDDNISFNPFFSLQNNLFFRLENLKSSSILNMKKQWMESKYCVLPINNVKI